MVKASPTGPGVNRQRRDIGNTPPKMTKTSQAKKWSGGHTAKGKTGARDR